MPHRLRGWAILVCIVGQVACSARYLDSPTNKYLLEWTFNSLNITFTVTVNTTGWIGLGFSPNGNMPNSDIVTAWVETGGTAQLQDRYATATALPDVDAQQDYHLVKGQVVNGQTIITFSRLLDTCDSYDRVITANTMTVIYAYGDLDSTGTIPAYHGIANRGVASLYLLSAEPENSMPNDTFTVDLELPKNVSIPAVGTTYWGSLVRFPNITKKVHMIKYAPVIQAGNEDIVHHILLYACTSPVNTSASSYSFFGGNDGGNTAKCSTLIGVWAVGGGPTYFPVEAGYPFGAEFSPDYVLYQTHYNNPSLSSGRTDSSHFRLYLTPTLRNQDAAIFEAGTTAGILVPPNQTAYAVSAFCSNNCTNMGVPSTGIKVFATILHSHLLGRRITVRHYRKNVELPILADDPSYNFAFQQSRFLENVTTVLPGDFFQTVCYMDSTSRTVATQGGFSTSQEMCIAYLFYYPKASITSCGSVPLYVINATDPLYAALNITFSSVNWLAGTSTAITGVEWTPLKLQALQVRQNGDVAAVCALDKYPRTYAIWSRPAVTLHMAYPSADNSSCFSSTTVSSMTVAASVCSTSLSCIGLIASVASLHSLYALTT